MLIVATAVIAAWAALVGTAYLARGVLGLPRAWSLAILAVCYLALAGLAIAVIGASGRGLLGAAGLLVPFAVSCALVRLTGR